MCLFLQNSFWVVHVPFVRIVKFQFLTQFPVDHLAHPIISILYSFYANLLHSLIMWLIVSSLSPYNLHLLFLLRLIYSCFHTLVLMALFCAAIRRGLSLLILLLSSFHSLRVFHTSGNWWSFTRMTASFLRSLELFQLFKPILTMLWSKWIWITLWSLFFIILLLWEFFTRVLADGLPLKTTSLLKPSYQCIQDGYMCFNQRGNISVLNGSSLKLVDKFSYLGSCLTSTETDINTRLAEAWTAIESLSVISKSDLTDKLNTVSSKQPSCRYCYMDALQRR